jgi:hypothetical protein
MSELYAIHILSQFHRIWKNLIEINGFCPVCRNMQLISYEYLYTQFCFPHYLKLAVYKGTINPTLLPLPYLEQDNHCKKRRGEKRRKKYHAAEVHGGHVDTLKQLKKIRLLLKML